MAKCSLYRVVIDGEIKKRQIILLSNNDETLEREIAAATNAKLRVEECQVCLAGNYLSNAVWRTIIFQNDITSNFAARSIN